MYVTFLQRSAAFHLGLYCVLTVISPPNKIESNINIPDSPKNENGLTKMIRTGKSIRHIRVKKVEELYCLCREIKDTDQLRGLPRLCFLHIMTRLIASSITSGIKFMSTRATIFNFRNTLMLLKHTRCSFKAF